MPRSLRPSPARLILSAGVDEYAVCDVDDELAKVPRYHAQETTRQVIENVQFEMLRVPFRITQDILQETADSRVVRLVV